MTYNTLATARNLTDLQTTRSYQDSVSTSDPLNFYQLQFGSRSGLSLSVTGLGADVNLEVIQDANRNGLVDSGEILASSTNAGSLAELLNLTLDKGTYYLRVALSNIGSTSYTLNVTASNSSPDLLWRSYSSGQNAVWSLNGTSIASTASLLTISDVSWQIESTNDLNNDGQADLLWRNYRTGQNAIWYMNGTTIASSASLMTIADLNWRIEGTGDFNNDGQVDLLWRDYRTGQNAIWYMSGTNIASSASLPTIADLNWRIEGVGDFNNDGQVDLLWRDYRTGQNAFWYLNRGALSSSAFLPTIADLNWRIEGTGDFNNDGQVDLLWRDYRTGQNAIWYMNGTTIASSAFLMTIADPNWRIAGVMRKSNPTSPPDSIGNTRFTALDIGALAGSGRFQDSVSATDTEDYYKFNLTTGSTVNLSLNGLSADANIRLLTSDGILVQTSNNSGTTSESISRQLDAGTYYIQISHEAGATNYTLGLSTTSIAAVDASLYWTRQLGTSAYDEAEKVAVDSQGNVYTAGITYGSLGGSLTGQRNVWLAKHTAKGEQLWIRQWGSYFDYCNGVTLDGSGNVYVLSGSAGGSPRVDKYSGSGALLWSRTDTSQLRNANGVVVDGVSSALDIVADSQGNYYITGSGYVLGAFVAKYNANGDHQWSRPRTRPSQTYDQPRSVTVDTQGNVYIAGITTSNLAGTNAGGQDAWLEKYSSNGTFQWIQQWGSANDDRAWAVKTDGAGDVYIAGTTFGTIATSSAGGQDAWLAKYSSSGVRQWIRQWGNANNDDARSLAIDVSNNIYIAGTTTNSAAVSNAWVARYSSAGVRQWERQFGNAGSISSRSAFIDNLGNLYAVGGTTGSLEGRNAGDSDAWLAKYQSNLFNATYGYGLIDAAAAVAQAIGQSKFADVADLGGNNWNNDLINAPEVWARGYTGQGVTVAVIDTGVDLTHSDLAGNLWRNAREIANNGIDDDGNGYIDDVNGWNFGMGESGNNVMPNYPSIETNGHGTHVAGTIAGLNNGMGITGVAYNAKIMSIKLGSISTPGGGMEGDLAKSIRYAVDNGARVINMSIGTGDYAALKDAIAYAASRGVITVSSAGNSASPTPGYPAAYANQYGIAVGAVDATRTIARFSNRAGTDSAMGFVVAPGVGVYSTLPGNRYDSWSGTSMAAPNVAGVVALMLSANPNLTVSQVRQILMNSAIGLNFSSQTAVTTGTFVDLAS